MARKNYHHGNLQAALIASGVELLRGKGIDAVTLRNVVRHAGVSPAAAYRHFASATDLLGAIAAEGFTALHTAMVAALTAPALADLSPLERIGQGYLQFVGSHPDHFRLIFSARIPAAERSAALTASGCAAFNVLFQAIEESRAQGHVKSTMPTPLIAAAAHSFIHGLSVLLLDQHLDPKELGFKSSVDLTRALQEIFKQGWGVASKAKPSRKSTYSSKRLKPR